MEKSPLRGTLAGKTGEHSKLRGSLADKAVEAKSVERPELRGTLAVTKSEKTLGESEGVAVSKDTLPDIESLASLAGRTIIQRDGGLRCEFIELRDGLRATDGKTVKLIGQNGFRYSIGAQMFLDAITTKGGAWRLLEV